MYVAWQCGTVSESVKLGSPLLQTLTSCGAPSRASFFIDKAKVSQLMCIGLTKGRAWL